MRRFSVRPAVTLKGRKFNGLRGFAGSGSVSTHREDSSMLGPKLFTASSTLTAL